MKYCKQCSIWQDKELSLKTSVHKLLDADNAAGRLHWFERGEKWLEDRDATHLKITA